MTAAERALAFVAALVLPDGRRWGEIAEPWQWEFASKFLNPNTKKPFSYVTRPRGGSKTFDVSACLLAIMFFQTPAGAHLYAVAADLDQAGLIRDTIQDLVRFNPDLADQLTITATTVRLKRNGVTLHILPADAPGSWGLRPHAIVIDELGQWPRTHRMRELLESMLSAVVKVKGCRLAVATTAADPTHYAHELLAHARASTKWGVYEVAGPLPWRSEEELEEQRSILTESSFRRLHLNEWTEAEDRLTTRDQLLACVTHSQPLPPRPNQLYLIAADLGIRVDPAVAVVAHLERSPSKERPESLETRVVIDCIERWEPTRRHPVSLDNVGDWILSTGRTYNRATVIFDPWQARHLGEQLTKKSLRVEEYVFTSASKDRLAQTLFLCIKDRVLALPDDAEMIEELLRVRIVESGPGILALEHDRGEHDDQAVAIGLAATRLLERGLPRDPRFRGVHIPPPPRYGLRSIL